MLIHFNPHSHIANHKNILFWHYININVVSRTTVLDHELVDHTYTTNHIAILDLFMNCIFASCFDVFVSYTVNF